MSSNKDILKGIDLVVQELNKLINDNQIKVTEALGPLDPDSDYPIKRFGYTFNDEGNIQILRFWE